ncbi:hypothetical protein FPV67DRAFT_1482283 [Lyophyllum atratum]|nr:hypothetical protein FPV67DRAFT_1482283 [Lyophyllum atratum]
MLRWCQSTVRALDGCGTSTIGVYTCRFRSSTVARRALFGYGLIKHDDVPMPVTCAPNARLPYSFVGKRIAGTRAFHAACSTVDLEAAIPAASESSPAAHPTPQTSAASSMADIDSLETLSNFLSPHNLRSSTPHILSADTLEMLYGSIKALNQLCRLSSKQLTELLSLLGSLSLPQPRNLCIYLNKFVLHMDGEDDHATHWAFVLEVARDKEKVLGQSLNGTDRYWVMRALLTKVVLAEGESLQPDDPRLRAFSQATMQYLRIWRHTCDPEIHVPYLQTLLSLGSPEHIAELVQRLCKVLELHAHLHARLVDLLWQVLLSHGHELSPALKARVLSMVATRLSRFAAAIHDQEKAIPSSNRTPLKRPTAFGPTELSTALCTALFPSSALNRTPPSIRHWAASQAKLAFKPDVALDTRWGNLLLLAIYKAPHLPAPERVTSSTEEPADVEGVGEVPSEDWRPVLVLAALEQTMHGGLGERRLSALEAKEGIRNIIRPLWRMWKAGAAVENGTKPVTVTRAIVATFFRVASQILDGALTEGCYRFCITHGLFGGGEAGSSAETVQTVHLRVAYVLASTACKGTSWQDVLQTSMFLESRCEVVEALLWHFLSSDVRAAYDVYTFAKEHDYRLSDRATRAMGLALVSSPTWHLAVPFLDGPSLSREQAEQLLLAILRVFQLERREYIDPPLAEALGRTLWRLYGEQAPEDRFKYPIRFFLPIMIASGHPARALSIVEAIHRHSQSFFTTRFFLRLMRTLVRFGHFHLTSRLLQLVPATPTRAADDFKRKLTLSLARAGAHTAARKVYASGVRRNGWRTPREAMARAVGFRVRCPSTRQTLPITSILARNPTHCPTIKYAAALLVRANRTYAARKLLKRAQPHLDRKTSTAIGNTILHAFLRQHRLRNGRLVRHTLRTKDMLEKECGFAPDRVTINIIIKTVLRWRLAIGPGEIKSLFDHMVRCGYPASARWCLPSGVPFGTPLVAPAFSLPALEEPISFERHVRPMYKMFVKALYVRQDVRAARTVLGILKEQEVLAMRKREERNRARRMGLVRKKMMEQERGKRMDIGNDAGKGQ